MAKDDTTYGATDKDPVEDTEGHDARRQFPAPPVLDGEDSWPQGFVGETGEGRAELDTEGHLRQALPPNPGGGDALPPRGGEGALPGRPGPGEHITGEADTEGHLMFRRRVGEVGE